MSQSYSLTPVNSVSDTGSVLQGFALANGTLFTSTVGNGDYAVGWSQPAVDSNNAPTFYVQLFDGSGNTISGPTAVTSPSEYAEYPSMVGSNQGYYVSWQSRNYNLRLSYPDPTLKTSPLAILQGTTNSSLTVFDGSEYASLGNSNAIIPYKGALSILKDGGVGIAYTESGSVAYRLFNNPIDPDEFEVSGDPNANLPLTDSTHTQLVGGSGTYPIYLGNDLDSVGSDSNIATATLNDGRVVVEWRSLSTADNLQMNVAVLNPGALPTGPDNSNAAIITNNVNNNEYSLGTIGVLGNGNFLTFYTGEYHGDVDSTLYAQQYDQNGNQVGAPVKVDSNADEETSSSATLSDGSVALGYSNGNKFLVQIFDPSGVPVGSPLLVTNDDEYRNVSLSALPGNKLAVSWVGEESANGTFGPKVKTQVFALQSVAPSVLFSIGNDTVDFNSLTANQISAVQTGTNSLYNALGGTDNITLPVDVSSTLPGTSTTFDGYQTFSLGDGDSTINAPGDYQANLSLGLGDYTLNTSSGLFAASFTSPGTTLDVDNDSGSEVLGSISNFGSTDTIDFTSMTGLTTYVKPLRNPTFSDTQSPDNVLYVYQGSNEVAELAFSGNTDMYSLEGSADGLGGTKITLDSTNVALVDPSPNALDWTFIHVNEGYRRVPYTTTSLGGGNDSGVTIGTGVDLGQDRRRNNRIGPNEVQGLFSAYSGNSNIAYLENAVGLSHAASINYIESNGPYAEFQGPKVTSIRSASVSLTTSQTNLITNYVEQANFRNVVSQFNKSAGPNGGSWMGLNYFAKTVVFDAAYNAGLGRVMQSNFWKDLVGTGANQTVYDYRQALADLPNVPVFAQRHAAEVAEFSKIDGLSQGLSAQASPGESNAEGNVFIFSQAGPTVVGSFVLDGPQHDAIQLPSSDFSSLAEVIRNTQNTVGGVTITDPTNGSTLQIAGVTKAELKANKQDLAFV